MTATLPTLAAGAEPTAAEMLTILDAIRMATNVKQVRLTTPATGSSSTSYADLAGLSVSFTKVTAASSVLVQIYGSGYLAASPSVLMTVGVKFGSTDYDMIGHYYTVAGPHDAWAGSLVITGLAAGAWTPQGRIKLGTASRTVNIDFNDHLSMIVSELAA